MISSSALPENQFPHIQEWCHQAARSRGSTLSPGYTSRTEEILAYARKAVQKGITAEELCYLDDFISAELKRVDRGLLRGVLKSMMPPEQLRAYEALRELDLSQMEGLCPQGVRGSRPARIPGLLSGCDTLHELMEDAVLSGPAVAGRNVTRGASAYESICQRAGEISSALEGRSVGSYSLSRQTFRAMQWIVFLQDPLHFEMHLEVLRRTVGLFWEHLQTEPRLAKYRKYNFHLRYFPGSSLFRMTSGVEVLHLTVNEGFLRAPDSVLQAVVRSALRCAGTADRQAMGAYSTSEDYLQISRRLLHQPGPGCPEQGLFHNLSDIYKGSVREYLPGNLPIPTMRWMEKTSYRTYGVYQSSSDTIRISPALDHPDVPEYVLGYVVFHELAHARVGVRVRGGRHQIHTKRFYAVERQYPMCRQAALFLSALSRKMS